MTFLIEANIEEGITMQTQRGMRLRRNTISSLILQITTLICGFVLPRLILTRFGTQVNGLVNSITQFLHIVSFMELGVGSVVQSALYSPLAHNEDESVSKIVSSANRFFFRIAVALSIYIIILTVI